MKLIILFGFLNLHLLSVRAQDLPRIQPSFFYNNGHELILIIKNENEFLLLDKEISGQSNTKVVATYERNTLARPFFVRWIKDVTGRRFGQLEKLQLKNDSSFYYSYRDRYCGTFNNECIGTWTVTKDILILRSSGACLVPWTALIINKRRLYSSLDSLNNGTWAMKKR